MKRAYLDCNFAASSLALIKKANAIIDEYIAQGYRLTVRQLYYQLVARDIVPNTLQSYKRVASMLNDARMAGLTDWNAIEDRTREFVRRSKWDGPRDLLNACAQQFHMDMWVDQQTRVFVIVEKEALAGVLEPICRTWDVPLLAARGYASVSVLREFALDDLVPAVNAGQEVLILHLGDHDPSGIDMTRDLRERLLTFVEAESSAEPHMELVRIALNRDQIDQYNPPPNPAKTTDSRFMQYMKEHGDESWELDALEPRVLVQLIETHVSAVVDSDAWDSRTEEINKHKVYIQKTADKAPE